MTSSTCRSDTPFNPAAIAAAGGRPDRALAWTRVARAAEWAGSCSLRQSVRLDQTGAVWLLAEGGHMTGGRTWTNDHPVLEALRARRADPGRPGSRPDGFRIGLAAEGGGMRGVISASMLCALEQLGLPVDRFDGVYGASSGATNCAYYIAGCAWYPLSIYYDDLTTRDFVDFRRALRGNILNLDYTYETVVERVKPLDYGAVLASPVPFHVAMTDVHRRRTFTVSEFASKEDLKSALRGSAWLPVAVRGAAPFRDRLVVDGGVLTAHPYQLAVDDGCTHVLSLSTRPIRPPKTRNGFAHYLGAHHLERLQPGLGKDYLAEVRRYREARRTLQRRMREPGSNPYVLDLAPLAWMPEVRRAELSPWPLMTGARQAYEVIYCAIEGVDPALLRTGEVRAVPRFEIVRGRRVDRS